MWSDNIEAVHSRVSPAGAFRSEIGARTATSPDKSPSFKATKPRRLIDPQKEYLRIRHELEQEIIGDRELCARLALAGVGMLIGVSHQRILLCGTTGSGKSHSARSLAKVLQRPYFAIDLSDVTATGWRGADIPDLLAALASRGDGSLDGSVLLLDEIDKCRVVPRTDGNSLQAQVQLQASLLALIDGGITTAEGSAARQLETAGLLVIATGAFGGRFAVRPPTTRELVTWGWMPELAARWGDRICLRRPSRHVAMELLERSDRSVSRRLGSLAEALGLQLLVSREALAYVVDLWYRSDSDFRSASEWLLSAARTRLIETLEHDAERQIVVVPDDIDVARDEIQPGDELA
ncbi:MAG: AAA family ATPase [Longimicrobiales bacterium]